MPEPHVAQRGPFAVAVEAGKEYWWCRCGLSRNQPFCDGSHRAGPFRPLRFRALRSETLYLCGCKHTAAPPLCDGSHKLVEGASGAAAVRAVEGAALKPS